ncbi:MAG: type II toxin-antitoxin system RelE/ParE family toxin [Desulfobulbaceae bacterium]|nr:type II toxin-antitoxin system RelE/ParE family toxin [Desulfobulbaceae bacterium]
MDILFISDKLEKEFNTQKLLIRRHGSDRANRISRRLSQLSAATVLKDLRNTPGRCHELKGDHADQLSLDLDHPYRLIFKPADNPSTSKPDGGLDWLRVTAVIIMGVEDTHE